VNDLDVAVVGSGMAGLAAAHRLRLAGLRTVVLEAAPVVGGRARSYRDGPFTLAVAAETLGRHGYPRTAELVRAAGLAGREAPLDGPLCGLWRGGRIHPWFAHPAGTLRCGGLGPAARASLSRMGARWLRSACRWPVDAPEDCPAGDQTVAEHAAPYGEEVLEYFLEPLVEAGFGWLPETGAASPFIAVAMLNRGIYRWTSFPGGIGELPAALAAGLDVRLEQPVERVAAGRDGIELAVAGGGSLGARSCLLAVPAPVALRLHPAMPDDERPFVAASTFTSALRVNYLLDRPLPVDRRLFAALLPRREGLGVSAAIFGSNITAARAPEGHAVLSLFSSTPPSPRLLAASDGEIAAELARRASPCFPWLEGAVVKALVHRIEPGVPSGSPEALRRRRAFADRPLRPVEYAGDWTLLAPSVEAAVRSGMTAAARLVRWHAARRAPARG
jgi:oxygen-dependent protoporphyrinogen oxidase